MAFNLSWAGAPMPDISDHDEDNTFGTSYGESEADDGLYQDDYDEVSFGEIGDTPAPSRGKGKGKKKATNMGGTAAVPKKLTLDFDSDDRRLIELKQKGHSDEAVAQEFEKQGRIQYTAKHVGHRWMRLKKLLIQQENERLDDELSDWHEGEDEQLEEIVKAVAPKFDHQIMLLEERRWHEISLHLGEKLGQRKYTGKACRDRSEAVKNGTALPPIEKAEDQEERSKIRDERIAAAKKARQDKRDQERAKQQRAAARAEAKKREVAESTRKKITDAIQKRNEKDIVERIKEERRVAKEDKKQNKKAARDLWRAEKQWKSDRKQAEEDLYKKWTGYNFGGKVPGRIRKNKDGYVSEEEAEASEDIDSDEEDIIDLITDDETDEDATAVSDSDLAEFTAEIEEASASNNKKRKRTSSTSENKTGPGYVVAEVSAGTLLNPRSIMNMDELEVLLKHRELPRRGPNESHAEIVARIAANDEVLKSDELSQHLMHACEKSKGKKLEKIARLREADARGSDKGQMGTQSTDLHFMRKYEGYFGKFWYLVEEAEEKAAAEVEDESGGESEGEVMED